MRCYFFFFFVVHVINDIPLEKKPMGVQIDISQGKYEAIILWYVTLSFRYVRPTLYCSSLVLAIRISDLLPLESFPNNVAHLVLGTYVYRMPVFGNIKYATSIPPTIRTMYDFHDSTNTEILNRKMGY